MARAGISVVYYGACLFGIWCILCLFRNAREGKLYQLQRAYGWVALCTAPIVFAQFFVGFGHGFSFDDLGEQLMIMPGSWFVLQGGQSVVHLFEENVKDWTGHRQSTMMDNWPVFAGLTLAQVLLLTVLVWRRFLKGRTLRDRGVLGIGLFLFVNAALAMQWKWFGS